MKIAIFAVSSLLTVSAFAAQPRADTGGAPDNGVVKGNVSCYAPGPSKKAKSAMEGGNEVARPKHCPGMLPHDQAYQTPKDGKYVIAGSRSFIKQVGWGAEVSIPGIPGAVGILCDLCPGCDKRGIKIDIASNNPAHKNACPLSKGALSLKIVKSAVKAAGR
jgi:hypothetical protein